MLLNGWSTIYVCTQAVCYAQEDLLDNLLQRCTETQINALDEKGFAALHYAVKYGMVNILKKLLAAQCGKFVLSVQRSYISSAIRANIMLIVHIQAMLMHCNFLTISFKCD